MPPTGLLDHAVNELALAHAIAVAGLIQGKRALLMFSMPPAHNDVCISGFYDLAARRPNVDLNTDFINGKSGYS